MPYNLPEKHQSKENEKKMERCVKAVMEDEDFDKSSAVAVCKARFGFTKDE